MRICATRLRENSNVNAFVRGKRENIISKSQILLFKSYFDHIFSSFFFFFQICRIYKALIMTMIYECKHSLLRRLIL